jgi:hypothetical protein
LARTLSRSWTLTKAGAHVLALPPNTVPAFGLIGCDAWRRPYLQIRKSTAFYFTDEQREAMRASPYYLTRDDHDFGDDDTIAVWETTDPMERYVFEQPEGTYWFWVLLNDPIHRTEGYFWWDCAGRLRDAQGGDRPAIKRAIEAAEGLADGYETLPWS